MTDLKTLDARILKVEGQLERLRNRRLRVAQTEQKSVERQRREQDSRRRTLAGDLLLDAVNRGVVSPSLLAGWCEAMEVDSRSRELLGV